jgi:photosystem II stability/assembly factor-like uncharacterized protein
MRPHLCVTLLGVLLLVSMSSAQWEKVNSPGGLSCLAGDGVMLFAGSRSGGMFCSADSGQHWRGAGLSGVSIRAIASIGNRVWAASGGGVLYRSADAGCSWTNLGEGYQIGAYRVALCSDRTTLFALTTYTQGVGEPRTVLSLSTDQGESWIERGLPRTWGQALAVSSTGLYVATDAGLYRSENNGLQWSQAGFPRQCILSLVATEQHVFAGADSGIYCCSDSGSSLTLTGREMQECAIKSLALNDAHLFALTSGGDLWRRPHGRTVTSVPRDGAEPVSSFTLCANYPNPFNPRTTIEYTLTRPAHVNLAVLNVLGQEVVTLVAEEHPAGTFRAVWDARGCSSGTYFYRIRVGNLERTKRMLLVQ